MTTILVGGKYDGWDNVHVPPEYLATDEGRTALQAGVDRQTALSNRNAADPLPDCGDEELQQEMTALQQKIREGLSTEDERKMLAAFVADPAACLEAVVAGREKAEEDEDESESESASKAKKPKAAKAKKGEDS